MRVDAKQLARAGYTYLGRLYSEMDCQAFVEKCLFDCGLKINLAGSNTWFRRMTWTGSPEECMRQFGKIPVGAFLFIVSNDGREPAKYRGDGIGNASHIGIYTGQGKGAIHSSASRGCVVESRFTGKSINGGWNRVGLWKNVMYDVEITAEGGHEPMGNAIVSGGNIAEPINMRTGPSTNELIIAKIPQGDEVELLERGQKWSKVRYQTYVGYVMNVFIHQGDSETIVPGEMISVSKIELESVYDKIGDMLGLRG